MKKVDKYTFGGTPAAVYLADLVVTVDDEALRRKVASTLADFRVKLNQLTKSYVDGDMSLRVFGSFLSMLRKEIEITFARYRIRVQAGLLGADHPYAARVIDLAQNVCIGELKQVQHSASQAKFDSKCAQRAASKLVLPAGSWRYLSVKPKYIKLPVSKHNRTTTELWARHIRKCAKLWARHNRKCANNQAE